MMAWPELRKARISLLLAASQRQVVPKDLGPGRRLPPRRLLTAAALAQLVQRCSWARSKRSLPSTRVDQRAAPLHRPPESLQTCPSRATALLVVSARPWRRSRRPPCCPDSGGAVCPATSSTRLGLPLPPPPHDGARHAFGQPWHRCARRSPRSSRCQSSRCPTCCTLHSRACSQVRACPLVAAARQSQRPPEQRRRAPLGKRP